MFSFVFNIGLATIVAAVVCSLLGLGYRTLPKERQSATAGRCLAALCAAIMVGLPCAGYRQAVINSEVRDRNNRIAAVETQIMRMGFDRKCTFNGFETRPGEPPNNSFPCLQRGEIRVVSNPYKGGLHYFVVAADGTPTRRRGITDYPIPFLFAPERNLIDDATLRAAFSPDAHS